MGFAELIEAIDSRGEEEKERIISRSEKTAKRLLKEAETRAKEIAESIFAEEDPELEATRTRILGESELRKKRSSTEVRSRVVQEVFDKANEAFSKIRDRGDYGSILEKLGEEVLVDEHLIVYVDERDAPLMKKILTSRGSNTEVRSGRSCLGGLIVERKDGSLSIHNTFESRLEKQKESLVEEVNRILFKGE